MAKFAVGDVVQCYCKEKDLFVTGHVTDVLSSYSFSALAPTVTYRVSNVAGEFDESELARANIQQLERFLALWTDPGFRPTKQADVICPLPGCKKPNDAGVSVCWGCGGELSKART